MNYKLAVIFSFSIAIPALIGWIRFKQIDSVYYPFLYCIWIGLLNEVIGELITSYGFSNAINNNIYVLMESLLLMWQFKKWNLFSRVKFLFPVLSGGFVLLWITESFLINDINYTISYFRIIYSFVLVMLSLTVISRQLSMERKVILKNSIFLICIAYVIYFTNKVIIGMFWLYGLRFSNQFAADLVWILIFINLFTNLIYALAVLWMPGKRRFSLQY